MINPHTKFEVSTFIHCEDMNGNAKCKNWGGLGLGVTQGHYQCHHSIKHIQLPVQGHHQVKNVGWTHMASTRSVSL